MPDIFVDTSGWGILLDVSQPFPPLASTLYRLASQQNHKMVTTNYIIAELVALLASPLRLPRKQAISFIENLKASPYIKIQHLDAKTDAQAFVNYFLVGKTRSGVWLIVLASW